MNSKISRPNIAKLLTKLYLCLWPCFFLCTGTVIADTPQGPVALRIASFNIQDVRSEDLDTPNNPRLKEIAAVIQRIRPNVLLLSELAVRQDGTEQNADRFCELYLAVPQSDSLEPIEFLSYTPATNTGLPSGHDLDNSGAVVSEISESSADQSQLSGQYANDCFGYGTFPGQYGMALLVDPDLHIQSDQIRTFQTFLWKDLPDHTAPTNPDGSMWYSDEAWNSFRLSSKNFADVPIVLPNDSVLHVLISHPTPPAFDGAEGRNKHRNHDEIMMIRKYIDNDPALVDDRGQSGGLGEGSSFVILGDLNADPSDGSSLNMVMLTQILTSTRVGDDVFPDSDYKIDGLDPTDTSDFRLRVDYVLPSADIRITSSGVWRLGESEGEFPSDHFPVWIETIIP